MPLTDDPVTTTAAVKSWARIDSDDTTDDDSLDLIVAAVDQVARVLPMVANTPAPDPDDTDYPWPGDVALGCTMLAARLLRRRNSPEGVAAFASDGPVYVQRNDPDIAQLLQLGDYARPGVG